MIKLSKTPAPPFLNAPEVARLTDEFISTGSSVWNFEDLKKALLESSHYKCAYCESSLNREGKYMEVDHYKCKELYPSDVMDWSNLIPSCKRCNGSKGTHDVVAEPIVNPYTEDPKNHLSFYLYRLQPKTDVGFNTIEATNLNDHQRAVQARFEIGESINKSLESAIDKLTLYESNKTTIRKNKLCRHVEGLLKECQRESPYSATTATVLHTNAVYAELKARMESNSIWSDELQELHLKSINLKL